MTSRISIIIPVYNQPRALELALDSIEKQTYKDIEVIVVDDGSSMECRMSRLSGILTPLDGVRPNGGPHTAGQNAPPQRDPAQCGTDFRMPIVIERQYNKGAPSARNRGFDLTKGEYVIFWDADVVGKPEMLEKFERQLRDHPNASFAYSNMYFGRKKMPGQLYNSTTLQLYNYIHTTSLIRRQDFPRFDESLKRFQDWDLWLTMAENGKQGVWIDEYLFTVAKGGTMSSWLPSFAYKKPWSYLPWVRGRVRAYQQAETIIREKHHLD